MNNMKIKEFILSLLIFPVMIALLPVLFVLGFIQEQIMYLKGYKYNAGWARYEKIEDPTDWIDAGL